MPDKLTRLLLGLGNMTAVIALAEAAGLICGRILPPAVAALLTAAALVALYLAGARWVEQRKAVELRLADSGRGLGSGMVLGVALVCCLMGLLWLARVFQPSGWGSTRSLPVGLAAALIGAVVEEIMFRGFLFRLLAGLGGNWMALGITSALFGMAHFDNRGATLATSGAIAIEAGILLGAAYAASGSLWLPIGIHTGWNFAEGAVFGMAVSGHAPRTPWIAGVLHGPVWLTGGVFGPEASAAAVVVCLAAAAMYLRKMAAPQR